MKQNFEESHTCIKSSAIPFSLSHWGLNRCVYDSATGIGFYSRQGIDVDKFMERNNLLIRHKHGKEIYMIERYLDTNMMRKYPWLKDKRFLINALWKGIISSLWVHTDTRLDVDEKKIIFRSIIFQNLVLNSCNAGLVTHLQVDLPWYLNSDR
jgi:hypothetical protein